MLYNLITKHEELFQIYLSQFFSWQCYLCTAIEMNLRFAAQQLMELTITWLPDSQVTQVHVEILHKNIN